jgi:hypothetical protein
MSKSPGAGLGPPPCMKGVITLGVAVATVVDALAGKGGKR